MSVLFRRQVRGLGDTSSELIPSRIGASGSVTVSPNAAMKHSAVWACIRVRAGLVASLPVDVYQYAGAIRVPVTTPGVLVKPGGLLLGGSPVGIEEWLYATQVDLDRYGNAFGLIVEQDGFFRPSRIDLVAASDVTVSVKGGQVSYKIKGQTYSPQQVWHERQYVVPGLPVGLSPVAYAAMAILQYANAQSFAASWFSTGATPAAWFKNTEKKVNRRQAVRLKDRWTQTMSNGDLLVTGSDWEYQMLGVDAKQSQFIEAQNFSIGDVCRFFDVPGDVIDAPGGASNVTYANVTQRFLQLLVVHLGPTIDRRESALTTVTSQNTFVKLNRDALLAMDPQTRTGVIKSRVDYGGLDPNEARALDDLPPLTDAQIELILRLRGTTDPEVAPAPSPQGVPA